MTPDARQRRWSAEDFDKAAQLLETLYRDDQDKTAEMVKAAMFREAAENTRDLLAAAEAGAQWKQERDEWEQGRIDAVKRLDKVRAERDEARQQRSDVLAELERIVKVLAETDDFISAVNACQPYASDLAKQRMAELTRLRPLAEVGEKVRADLAAAHAREEVLREWLGDREDELHSIIQSCERTGDRANQTVAEALYREIGSLLVRFLALLPAEAATPVVVDDGCDGSDVCPCKECNRPAEAATKEGA
ncbi:MAG: hypothetical protein NUW22_12385 [Acidobacteria bacterium]|nr:hypothetical protein [Acidobacteriota bacterium]